MGREMGDVQSDVGGPESCRPHGDGLELRRSDIKHALGTQVVCRSTSGEVISRVYAGDGRGPARTGVLEGVVEQHAVRLQPLEERNLLVLGSRGRVVQTLRPSNDGEETKETVPASTTPLASYEWRDGRTHSILASEMTAVSLAILSAISIRPLVASCLDRRQYMTTCDE